ncbi:MAG: AtpZ/AtpI family protein [Phycisphaerales bacterium]|nr:AtpZ/AtpI family protein [Phycisphaerales bacterium]
MPASDNNPNWNSPQDGEGDSANDSSGDSKRDRLAPFSPMRLVLLSPDARRKRDLKETRLGWKMAALGWEFSSHVVAGVALGWGADYLFPNLGHWGIIFGSSASVLVGTATFLRSAMKLNSELEGDGKKPQNGGKNG